MSIPTVAIQNVDRTNASQRGMYLLVLSVICNNYRAPHPKRPRVSDRLKAALIVTIKG